MADKQALVDSGATDNFMHPALQKEWGWDSKNSQTQKDIQY
jgi:hypothetical protein